MVTITNPDWVPPIEETFDEGKPIRSLQGLMLAGNPVAMGLGKPGAQRILGRAVMSDPNILTDGYFITVAAADTYELESGAGFGQVIDTSLSNSSTYSTRGTLTLYGYSGSLRFKGSFRKNITSGGNSYLRILLNGAVVNSWSTSSTTFVQKVQDITVAPGDVVEWQIADSGGGVYFQYDGTFADDALYRLGAVAKRSDG